MCGCSAAKFGVEYREPERRRDLRHVVRKEKALERAAARPTFNPGLDLFSEVGTELLCSSAPCLTRAAAARVKRVVQQTCAPGPEGHWQLGRPALTYCGQFSPGVSVSPHPQQDAAATVTHPQEEIQRRRERASRFQTEDSLAAYQPAVDPADVAKRKKRAERFGTEYQPEDAAGLMDVGACSPKCTAGQQWCCHERNHRKGGRVVAQPQTAVNLQPLQRRSPCSRQPVCSCVTCAVARRVQTCWSRSGRWRPRWHGGGRRSTCMAWTCSTRRRCGCLRV